MAQSDSGAQAGSHSTPKRELNLFDTTSIIVSIVLGTGIYMTTPSIAGKVPSVAWLFGVWIAGAALSFVGALCYGELTSMYPRAGGDYFYLTRAYGRDPGFLFAWSELWVTRPGNIGALAFVFAQYAYHLWPWAENMTGSIEVWPWGEVTVKAVALLVYAAAPVVLLTGVNILGVHEGKWTQNVLTILKLGGPVMILVAGLMFSSEAQAGAAPAAAAPFERPFDFGAVKLALILVLFTYGGWSEIATVGAEVRNPEKNMLRSLLLGVGAVTVIYLVLNYMFLHVLGFEAFGKSETVAADTVRPALGPIGDKLISLMITISALGAMSAQIFTGGRIYYAMGKDHPLYAWLGRWNERSGTPVRSLVLQAAASVALIVDFGLSESAKAGAFEQIVAFTAPLFWAFFTMVGLSVFVFRAFEPNAPRPFRVPLFPLPPILFCLMTVFMLYASIDYAINVGGNKTFWWVGMMAVGVAMVFVNRFFTPKQRE